MINIPKIYTGTIVLFLFIFSTGIAMAYEGSVKSQDGNLFVSYKVEKGYEVSITISTKAKNRFIHIAS